jgi:hypothetical protein
VSIRYGESSSRSAIGTGALFSVCMSLGLLPLS